MLLISLILVICTQRNVRRNKNFYGYIVAQLQINHKTVKDFASRSMAALCLEMAR